MIRLSFSNMTLESDIFNLQRQPSRLDDIETSTLNLVKDFNFDDEFGDMSVAEYGSFIIDVEFECDVFEFDDLSSLSECLIASVTES